PFRSACQRAGSPPTVNGWVEDGYKHNNAGYGEFDADWTVPAKPSTGNGLVYLFNGIEREDQTRILQPVLMYNYSHANERSIASWNCGNAGTYCGHSPIKSVSTGDHIHGSIYGSSCNPSTGACSWLVTTSDWTNGNLTQYSGVASVPYTWSYVSLEAYFI